MNIKVQRYSLNMDIKAQRYSSNIQRYSINIYIHYIDISNSWISKYKDIFSSMDIQYKYILKSWILGTIIFFKHGYSIQRYSSKCGCLIRKYIL